MAIYNSDKDIYLWKGDSGNITFDGLPVDKDYTVYFSISDPETNKIIAEELSIQSERRKKVTFYLDTNFTDLLRVPVGETKATYQYGLKICNGQDEETLIPEVDVSGEKPIFQKAPKVYVFQKFIEGRIHDN